MTDLNPSSNDILARIRAQTSGAKSSGAKPAQAATPSGVPEIPVPSDNPQGQSAKLSAPSPPAGQAKPAPTPGSTADILAAARARAGAAKASPPAQTAEQSGAVKAKPPAKKAAGSPADIMAAIRGGAASASAAPTEHSADRPSPPTGTPTKAIVSGPRPAMSAVEMIRAARQGGIETPDGSAGPRVALPSKPLAAVAKPGAAKPAAAEEPRRGFLVSCLSVVLSPLVVAWGSFTAAIVASTLATARFMMPNVLVEPPTRFKIGPPNDYAPGTVTTKWQAQFQIWVVNAEVDGTSVIYALSTVCTHLGCTPNWLEGEQKFKCPCHGSGFYKSGINFEGPAPRPLERFGLRLAEDGMLEVDKSIKFQRELGQWLNPACFVPVS